MGTAAGSTRAVRDLLLRCWRCVSDRIGGFVHGVVNGFVGKGPVVVATDAAYKNKLPAFGYIASDGRGVLTGGVRVLHAWTPPDQGSSSG